jgi:hypothetical protein
LHRLWAIPKEDKARLKRMRLPGRSILPLIVVAVCVCWLFDSMGRLELFIPVTASIAAFVLILVVKWRLRRYVWFWVTITVFAALHVAMLRLVAWPKGRIPAATSTGAGIIDIFAMLAIISVVGHLCGSEV